MGSQAIPWLIPLIFVSILVLWRNSKTPLEWIWSSTLQSILVLLIATCGFFLHPDWAYASVAWASFVLFFPLPRSIVAQFDSSIANLDRKKLQRCAKRLPYFYWGKQGEVWRDLSEAMLSFMDGNADRANTILDKWETQTLPPSLASNIRSYRTTGNAIVWNWRGIVEDFERGVRDKRHEQRTTIISASRAYAELGQIGEAAQLIELIKLPAMKINIQYLALSLLPFFCLAGARREVEKLMNIISRKPTVFPEHARFYWRGRLAIAEGDIEEGKLMMERARSTVTDASSPWHQRINLQLNQLDPAIVISHPDWSGPIDKIWKIFERCCYVQSVVAPGQSSRAVGGLVIAILVSYLITDSYTFYHSDWTAQIKVTAYDLGMLEPARVFAGEYWRLFTYLFLHAHVSHVLLNVLGLYWFGRIAENIYGTKRFFAIYFVSGILSGVANAVFDPSRFAIGASGAVMGIFGAVGVGIFRLKGAIPASLRRSELYWIVGLALAQVVLDQIIPQVAAMAHLGGMLAGIVLGWLLFIPKRKPVD